MIQFTKRSQPSHVIMSFDTYQHLSERLTELEDIALGKVAEAALSQSSMVGTETFGLSRIYGDNKILFN